MIPEAYLPQGSTPSVEKMNWDSGAPVNLKKRVWPKITIISIRHAQLIIIFKIPPFAWCTVPLSLRIVKLFSRQIKEK